ncbi:hypothetical protein ABZ726_07605 [Streptomyces hundungensis]|uniref:hypothetical protein n=1 Tax=Streptomyces hundungensis TaxID=1077946 RepID=UPI0033F2FFB3
MPEQLTAYETLVMPDYGGFDLYDADFDVRDNDLIPLARENVAAGNGYEVMVVPAQSQFKVKLRIETWTEEPAPPAGWEGHCDLHMEFPTGELVISERTRGAWGITIAEGDRHARLSFRGRSEAKHVAESSGPQDDLSLYEGTEQYLLQLWPRTS